MNHYAQALAELQVQPDHELKQVGDQWQTPKPLALGLFHYFAPTLGPVVLDMFADDCNHLVPHYYDAADNALTQDLAADLRRLGGAAYGNPPYSRPCVDGEGNPITGMEPILNFCREQRAQGAKIMLLIKAATSETWWPEDADFIQFISGRIGFEVPSWYNPRDPKKDKPSSSGFASAVVIFDASWQGERRPEARLRRDDLITTGQIILDMIHRQAVALNEEASRTIEAARHADNQAEARGHVDDIHVVELTEQPAIANPAAWDQTALTDNETNAQRDVQLSSESLQLVAAATGQHPDYAEPGLYLVRYVDEVAELSDADQNTLRSYLKGWFDEGESPSEICYRLTLAAANLKAGKQVHDGFVLSGRTPTMPHWQRHPAVKAVIYQIDDADILTPAKTAELAGWIIDQLADYLDAPDQLLELATAKAADLLAQPAEVAA
ncbi:phage N-6-adenine-methyltransferase [Aeromonas veronii]